MRACGAGQPASQFTEKPAAMIEQIRKFGWLAVEAGILLVVLCVLLNIILGKDAGPFISSVSENASKFLGALPPGVTLGVALILALYWLLKSRMP
jgi:hypothetical protein